jgi:tetratricopeptide (TPR) repeat protein
VQQDPKSIEYLQAAFKAALAVKDYSATAAAVSAISAAAPDRAIGPYLAGVLADAQGKSDEAVRQYARALEIEPKAQEPLSAAVRQLMQQKRGDKALQLIDGIVARAPDDAFALNLRGELLASQQRWPEASASLEAASKVAPQWWLPVRNLALAHIGQGDTGGALQVLKDAAGRLEQSEPVAVDLATLLQRSGRTDEAIAAYQALATRHPESEVGANNLAMLLVSTRTDSVSLKQAGDLVARFSQSKNPDYLDTRGWVLLKQGRAPEAVPVLEQAVSIAPEESATRYHLALAQFAAGQKQAARDNLERALQSKKDFEGIADARAKLAEWKQAG